MSKQSYHAAWYAALLSASRSIDLHCLKRSFNASHWMASAQQATGLFDFGDKSLGDVEAALSVWLAAVEQEAELGPLGRFVLSQEARQTLSMRLKVIETLKQHPYISEEKIERPLFIIGLPRSGTTMLHRLLAMHSDYRAPLFWELRYPVSYDLKKDTRRRDCERQVKALLTISPKFRTIHPLYAEEPEECIISMTQSYLTTLLDTRARAPGYLRWIFTQDMSASYRYYRAVLQLLQCQQPQRKWLLKAPEHLFWLDAILAVYPQARFLHLHRDPVKVAPSGCSLTAASRATANERLNLHRLGPEWIELWGGAVEKAMEARARHPEKFFDVSYQKLVSEPAKTTRNIFEQLGEAIPNDWESSVEKWLVQNPADRHGKHTYTLEEFGLSQGQVKERFQNYWERFGA
jgi:hypothetical protein